MSVIFTLWYRGTLSYYFGQKDFRKVKTYAKNCRIFSPSSCLTFPVINCEYGEQEGVNKSYNGTFVFERKRLNTSEITNFLTDFVQDCSSELGISNYGKYSSSTSVINYSPSASFLCHVTSTLIPGFLTRFDSLH